MKGLRKMWFVLMMTTILVLATPPKQEAQGAVAIAVIIKEAVKKVIKAVDLMIQRLQNKTIWLQNAQKVLENKLSELKLTQIAEWSEKHRKIYQEYYDELWQIKNALATYQRIRFIMDRQVRIVKEYNRAWTLISNDGHFTENEIDYMYRIYKGILSESIDNLDQLILVVNPLKVKMTDAERLAIVSQAGWRIERNLIDLLDFNMNTFQLSVSRAKSEAEAKRLRELYGL